MKRFPKTAFAGLFASLLLLLTTACSGNEKHNAHDSTSALIQQNTNIVAFGKASVMDILNKADYKHIPKLNVILGAQLQTWKKGFQIDAPVYFAAEAPFEADGTPAAIYFLMDVTNKDSLLSVISEMGYALEKSGEMSWFQENDVTFGVKDQLFILLSKKAPYDGKAIIEKAFNDAAGDLSEGKTSEILDMPGDIVTGLSIERLYGTANTSLNKLPQAKQDELKGLVADGFIANTVAFENGKAVVSIKNMFSEELKDRLFFQDNNGKALVNKLGNGKPWMGIAANIDMQKFEKFVTDFAPDANRKITEQLPDEAGFMLMALGGNAYSSIFSGQMGMVATGNPKTDLGMIFEFNAFLGLGKKGDSIKQMITENLAGAPMQGDAYVMDNTAIAARKDGIYIFSASGAKTGGKLEFPSYAKGFGEKTFSMFIAFEQMDMKSLELDEEMKVLEIMKYFTATADRDGATITLAAKDSSKNILKSVGDYYVGIMQDKIDQIVF